MENHATPSRAVALSQAGFCGLIGTSAQMQQVFDLIEKVSQHTYPILILGESGTGKELVARSIHALGPRRKKPIAPVDCAALVPTLIESELFGHVKGAFTGADQSVRGLFVGASEGTLFLDEIGELPVDLQAKLLRVLQEKEIRPIGSTERIPVNVRIIAATNRDLEAAIRDRTFRQDLYFRLNVVQIKLPSLRERKSDLPLLVNHFLEKFSDPREPARTISDGAMHRLMSYSWPGNVRELENSIERALALSPGSVLQESDVPPNIGYEAGRLPTDNEVMPLEEIERRAIFRALQQTGGDKQAAAILLGIGKTTMYRKLILYGHDGPRFRAFPVSMEDSKVEPFLICMKLNCRHLVDLRERYERTPNSEDLPRNCPDCGHFLSRFCPFCTRPLDVIWRADLPLCQKCGRELNAGAV
jgi:two-component system response regulator HydG